MGSSLKLSLSANTVVFIGYSLRDFDFQKIFDLLKTEMGDLIKHSFIVTTDAAHLNEKYSDNITPIITDGNFSLFILLKIYLMIEKYQFLI